VDDVPVESVAVGDVLLVRPGELSPTDGTILAGAAAVDASALIR
jgi:P-type Cu+ transporter